MNKVLFIYNVLREYEILTGYEHPKWDNLPKEKKEKFINGVNELLGNSFNNIHVYNALDYFEDFGDDTIPLLITLAKIIKTINKSEIEKTILKK